MALLATIAAAGAIASAPHVAPSPAVTPAAGPCTLAAAHVCEVPAGATPATSTRVMVRSLAIARRWWGASPLCGTPTYWRAAMTSTGEADDALCRIYLRVDAPAQRPDATTLCAIVAHEYGHLLGVGHGLGVMAPEIAATPTPCIHAWPHGWANTPQRRPIVWTARGLPAAAPYTVAPRSALTGRGTPTKGPTP